MVGRLPAAASHQGAVVAPDAAAGGLGATGAGAAEEVGAIKPELELLTGDGEPPGLDSAPLEVSTVGSPVPRFARQERTPLVR